MCVCIDLLVPVCNFTSSTFFQPCIHSQSQERFTNFYNLSGAVSILLKQLPEKVTEIKQSGGGSMYTTLNASFL